MTYLVVVALTFGENAAGNALDEYVVKKFAPSMTNSLVNPVILLGHITVTLSPFVRSFDPHTCGCWPPVIYVHCCEVSFVPTAVDLITR